MATTPVSAWGALEIDYQAYGKPHTIRMWVPAFDVSPGVGNFDAPGTPASLDALATEFSGKMGAIYTSDAAISFGAWRGRRVISSVDGSGHVIVEGTVTPGSFSAITGPNTPGPVTQATWVFRDAIGKLVKYEMLGAQYNGPTPFVYSSIGGAFKAFADYITGSSRIYSRSTNVISSMIHLNFDTNDGLTRRYRR